MNELEKLKRYQKAAERLDKVKRGFYLKRKQLAEAEKEYHEAQIAFEKSKE